MAESAVRSEKKGASQKASCCSSGACEAQTLPPDPKEPLQGARYRLEGLTCASCAGKIERELNRLEGVRAELHFASSTLVVEAEDPALQKRALEVVTRIEPEVRPVRLDAEHLEEEPQGVSPILKVVAASGLVFVLALAVERFALPGAADLPLGDPRFWAVLFPYVLAYAIAGQDVVRQAVRGVLRGDVFGESFLMSVATLGAFAIREFPEAVAVMLFFKVGQYFEDRALNHSRRSIAALLKIRADYANLRRNGETVRVPPEQVRVGDRILVKPGEKVPLDGVIEEGRTTVDASALTGESRPRSVGEGDEILSGMVNRSGVVTVRVTKPFGESTVKKILDLVETAAARKAPTEAFITKFSRVYTPAVVLGAVLLAVTPPLLYQVPALAGWFGHPETYAEWIYRALVFLVISCPCALVISIPLGFFGGIGAASRRGVLFKGANYLEGFRSVRSLVFDKTGTLTQGVFRVTRVVPHNGFSEDELLALAAAAESHSSHPIARSVVEAYGRPIDEDRIERYEEIPAHGVRAVIDGREVLAGNDRILHLDGDDLEHDTCELEGTVVHVAVDGTYAGYLLLADEPRPEARETLERLRAEGVRQMVMLTGDETQAAEAVARKLGLDAYHAELLPQDKVEWVERIKAEQGDPKAKVAFVGDGINDAPVLAAADIGVAMGGLGSDAAIEAADVVLMEDRLTGLVAAVHVARRTNRIVRGNIAMALGVKGVFILLGAAGVASMWEAVFADVGVAVLAVLNATRILKDSGRA
ncbi:heavy metal translocating P-type ATPase [Deferrisoma camini]|uniref:heavy metal translocating P-type ATPase n=1 Tax=Deferrisoma camini TaxID=1035120 RepID=UPI00046CDA55|nr:heavy metal translocating P-type ATPase [Deferrisoma camini]